MGSNGKNNAQNNRNSRKIQASADVRFSSHRHPRALKYLTFRRIALFCALRSAFCGSAALRAGSSSRRNQFLVSCLTTGVQSSAVQKSSLKNTGDLQGADVRRMQQKPLK